MPFVEVSWLAGRSSEQKQEVAARVVAAVAEVGGVPPGSVWVVFRDVPREDWVLGSAVAEAVADQKDRPTDPTKESS